MKSYAILALTLLLAAAACTPTTPQAPEMPAQRPADFEVRFHESGGPEDPTSDYIVGPNESSMKNSDGQWIFRTDPKELDALYASLVKAKVIDLKSVVEAGKDKNRFGYKLDMFYNGSLFSVTDQGDTYIQKEADYHRFMDALADIRAFVGAGLQTMMFPVAMELVLDPKSPKPEALSVDLEEMNLIAYNDSYQPGDTLQGEARPLKGTYRLSATAKVDGKDWTWARDVDVLEGGSHFMLILSKTGFKEAH